MSDKNKTKAQIIEEMATLRERNAELEVSQAEAKIQAERMTLLNKMSQELSRAVNEVEVFKTTARYTYQIFTQAERASVTLLDATGDSFDVFALEEGQTDVTRYGEPIPIEGRAIGIIVRENRLMSTPDIRNSDLLDFRSLTEAGIRSVIGAPLVTGGRVIGTLNVASKSLNAFNRRDEEMILQITALLASIIENRRLFDETSRLLAETEERNSELAIINSVGEGLAKQLEFQAIIDLVGDKISDIFQAHSMGIGFLDPETNMIHPSYSLLLGQRQTIEPYKFGENLGSHLARSGRPLLIKENAPQRFAELGVVYVPDEDDPIKSWLGVPILAGDKAIGGIVLQDTKENAFTEGDVRLLSTLAANMGVAIQNARLFNELQTRNREIAEALQQQTATSEILRAMADSPSDVQPVFDAIAKNAANLGGTAVSTVYRYDGQLLHAVAMHNLPPENVAAVRKAYPRPLTRDVGLSAMSIIDRTPYNVADVEQDPRVPPHMVKISLDAGMRSALFVPMIRQGVAIGAIGILRREAGAFTEKQIALLNTFADQAIIAIENVELFNETKRLLTETQQRNAELAIINSVSEGLVKQLEFQAIIDLVGDKIRETFQADTTYIILYDRQAKLMSSPYYVERGHRHYHKPETPGRASFSWHIVQTNEALFFNNMEEQIAHGAARYIPSPGAEKDLNESYLGVPIHAGQTSGVLSVQSYKKQAYSESDLRLLSTIAANLGVALENARLFDETTRLLAESEAQVTELSTLNIISEGLVGQLDLQSVIDLVGDQIREIIDAEMFGIALYDSESNMFDFPYFFLGDSRVHPEPIPLGEGLVSTVIQSSHPLMLDTIQEALDHGVVIPKQLQDRPPPEEYSWLGVPIVIGQEATGVIYITKHQNYAFSKADVRLLATIAANMGVAIENARLFERIQQTNQDLSQTLEELRSTQGQLVEAEKMAALGGLVAGVAHEINTPVGVGVTAASTLQDKTSGFSEVYKSGQMKRSDLEKYLNIAEQSSAMILRNLERAAELIQSFKQVAVDQSSEERRSFLVRAYLEEILLSLRPKLKKSQLTIEIKGDDSLTLDSYPGAFSQIVTNLVMNSLLHAYGPDDQGQLTFDLNQRDGRLVFEYNDDGKGIPEENLSKIFEPFFTTKRTQGGSGLGLHIIYNLVTQRLGGAIHCRSEVGSGTKFIIEVPVS